MEREAEKVAAYHEAGHMVTAWELGLDVQGATIIPNPETGRAGGVVIPFDERLRYADWVDEREYLYAHLVAWCAGAEAGDMYLGAPMPDVDLGLVISTPDSDLERMAHFVIELGGPDESSQVEVGDDAVRHARNLLAARWEEVSEIAGVLMERGTLDADECREQLEGARG